MCRLVVFEGACTRCNDKHTWDELMQQLSCLAAKNNGTFGDCANGIFMEKHDFDQECQRCIDEDEGVADMGYETRSMLETKRGASDDSASQNTKKQRT